MSVCVVLTKKVNTLLLYFVPKLTALITNKYKKNTLFEKI